MSVAAGPGTRPTGFSGPITISSGGTYTGLKVKATGGSVAVRIGTASPVTIQDSWIEAEQGACIQSGFGDGNTNLTVQRTVLMGVHPGGSGRFHGRALDIEGVYGLTVENCWGEKTGGFIYLLNNGNRVDRLKVRYNQMRNIEGRSTNGSGGYTSGGESNTILRQFIQLNQCYPVIAGEVAWNEIINRGLESFVEDNMNFYRSGGGNTDRVQVHHNCVWGGYPNGVNEGYSGGGILAGDAGTTGGGVMVRDNWVMGTTNYGISIAGGTNSRLANNRVVMSGRDHAGRVYTATNVGLYIWDQYGNAGNNDEYGNVVGCWRAHQGIRNDYYIPDCSGQCETGSYRAGSISYADEQAEHTAFVAATNTGGVSVGIGTAAPPTDPPPVANAGADQTVVEFGQVNLDGRGSSDVEDAPGGDTNGTLLGYSWARLSGPTVSLTGATTATPSFVAPDVASPSAIVFRLTVTDSDSRTDTDDVTVTVNPATAGDLEPTDYVLRYDIDEGSGSVLDNKGTLAAAGDLTILGPTWQTVAGGGGVSTHELVFDGVDDRAQKTGLVSAPVTGSSFTLAVLAKLPAGDASGNRLLQLSVGDDYLNSLFLQSDYGLLHGGFVTAGDWACQASAANMGGVSGDGQAHWIVVTVTNSGSVRTARLYVDGVLKATSSGATTTAPVVTAISLGNQPNNAGDTPGGWAFAGPIRAARVYNRALTEAEIGNLGRLGGALPGNTAPVAEAGASQAVSPGGSFTLDGSGSSDVEDTGGAADAGGVLGYVWAFVSGPQQRPPTSATSRLSVQNTTGWASGVYTYRVTVTDSQGATGTDTVAVTVLAGNVAPTVDAGADVVGTVGVLFSRTGVANDPGGAVVGHQWELESKPTGSTATITGASTQTVSITPDVTGDYLLRYRAQDDGGAWSLWDSFALRVETAVGDICHVTVDATPPPGTGQVRATVRVRRQDGSTITTGTIVARVDRFGVVVGSAEWLPGTTSVPPGPAAPAVDAGTNVTGHVTGTQFARTAAENDNGSTITARAWTVESGPAAVGATIGTAAALTWTPSTVGSYVLRYTATNAVGSGTDTTAIDVVAVTAAPTVNAGSDVGSHVTGTQFARTATENANGATITARTWKIQTGPTGVGSTIGTAAALSWTPSTVGTYVLRYSATNSAGTGTDDMSITVVAVPANEPTDYVLAYDINEGSGGTLDNKASTGADYDLVHEGAGFTWIAGPGGSTAKTNAVRFLRASGAGATALNVATDPLGGSKNVTVAVLARMPGVYHENAVPFIVGNDSADGILFTVFHDTEGRMRGSAGTVLDLDSAPNFAATGGDGQFHSWVMRLTVSSSNVIGALFLDGTQIATQTVAATTIAPTNPGYIGLFQRPFAGTNDRTDADVAAIRVYARALTSTEIGALFT